MFAAMKQTQERFEEREAYTDFIKLAGCVMTSEGLGDAARRAQEKGWTRVAQALTKATVAGTTVAATVLYSSQGSRDAALKTGMLEGWSQGHDRLDDLLATLVS